MQPGGGNPMKGFNLNLKQLKCFYYVAKARSFTKAAAQLWVSQPAATKQVQALEKYYGVDLFVKNTNPPVLTEIGACLYAQAEQIMRLAQEAEHSVLSMRQRPGGVIRLGCTKTHAHAVLPGYIGRFLRAHPSVAVELEEGASAQLLADLLYGRMDVVIAGGIEYAELDGSFHAVPFSGHEVAELVAVVPPSHRFAGRASIAIEEVLREEPLILRERGSGTREVVEKHAERHHTLTRPLLETGNLDVIKKVIHTLGGVGILASISVSAEIEAGSLVAIPFTEPIKINSDVVTRKEGYQPPALPLFLSTLLQKDSSAEALGQRAR